MQDDLTNFCRVILLWHGLHYPYSSQKCIGFTDGEGLRPGYRWGTFLLWIWPSKSNGHSLINRHLTAAAFLHAAAAASSVRQIRQCHVTKPRTRIQLPGGTHPKSTDLFWLVHFNMGRLTTFLQLPPLPHTQDVTLHHTFDVFTNMYWSVTNVVRHERL
jgi:hypothetical protein